MLTMNSHGGEISIAGCVEELKYHACFFYFYFYHVLCIIQLLGAKTTCSASYGKERTPSPIFFSNPAPGKKPSTQVSLVRDQPHTSHAKQEIPLRLSGQKEKYK